MNKLVKAAQIQMATLLSARLAKAFKQIDKGENVTVKIPSKPFTDLLKHVSRKKNPLGESEK